MPGFRFRSLAYPLSPLPSPGFSYSHGPCGVCFHWGITIPPIPVFFWELFFGAQLVQVLVGSEMPLESETFSPRFSQLLMRDHTPSIYEFAAR